MTSHLNNLNCICRLIGVYVYVCIRELHVGSTLNCEVWVNIRHSIILHSAHSVSSNVWSNWIHFFLVLRVSSRFIAHCYRRCDSIWCIHYMSLNPFCISVCLILYNQNTKLNITKSICDFRKQYDSLFYAEYADGIVRCITKKASTPFFFWRAQRKCHQMFVISIDIQYLSAFDISMNKKSIKYIQ